MGCVVDDVSDSVVAPDAVTVPPTADLVVTKGVGHAGSGTQGKRTDCCAWGRIANSKGRTGTQGLEGAARERERE